MDAADAAPAVVFDQAALDKLRELDPEGRRGFVEQVFRAFEASLQRHLERLGPADGAVPEPKLAAEVAHTLKSSSAAVGAVDLAERCGRLERVAKGVDHGDIVPALGAMRSEGERVLQAVRAMLKA